MLSNVRVPTTAQIRALEAAWIEAANGTDPKNTANWGQVLMEVAGRGAALAALPLWDENAGHVSVICGSGNNGGDGLVVARYLSIWGIPTTCFILARDGKHEMSTPEAATNLRLLEMSGGQIMFLDEDGSEPESKSGSKSGPKSESETDSNSESIESTLSSVMDGSTLIVDAIFGTGLSRPVTGLAKKVIDLINGSYKPVLAIDMPSGINSDTGQIMGTAVRAVKTVTFGYLKPGQLQYPGAANTGDLHLVDIGLPDFSYIKSAALDKDHDRDKDNKQIYVTTCGAVQSVLPGRPHNSNKGTFGNLLTIAGSLGMSGAGVLCGFSALRSGAGLSYVATAKSLITSLPAEELVYRPLSETSAQSISREALKEVTPLLDSISAVVLGPGMSQNADTVSFVLDIFDLINKPCVIDADGLNALSQNTKSLGKPASNFVLTPHPKELARLTNRTVADISANRIDACLAAAREFECVVVLKGAYTVIAAPDGQVYINPTGNSGMSTAGAGDVLSGIIGGLMAQGLSPLDAAVAGTYLHGKAGDIAASTVGAAGIVAGDITAAIPPALSAINSGEVSHLEELLSASVGSV